MINCIVPDYDFGNIKSVSQALIHLGCSVNHDLSTLSSNDILVLPGVGHYGFAVNQISDADRLSISNHASFGSKIIGICLGMQLLLDKSDEAQGEKGLSLINGNVLKLPVNKASKQKFHLGWHSVLSTDNPCMNNRSYYFIHQYFCCPSDSSIVTSSFNWNSQRLCASFRHNNIYGFQFHPEKSGNSGLDLLSQCLQ